LIAYNQEYIYIYILETYLFIFVSLLLENIKSPLFMVLIHSSPYKY